MAWDIETKKTVLDATLEPVTEIFATSDDTIDIGDVVKIVASEAVLTAPGDIASDLAYGIVVGKQITGNVIVLVHGTVNKLGLNTATFDTLDELKTKLRPLGIFIR